MALRKMIAAFLVIVSLISVTAIAFAVEAESGSDYAYGDINGDGKIDTKDLTGLMKHIAGTDADVHGVDLNGDGEISAKDLTRLMKVIAGDYDGIEPPETTAPSYEISGYSPKYNILAFKEGAVYCFSGLRGFNGHIPTEIHDGELLADSEMLADMLGFSHEYCPEEGILKLSYEKSTLVFDIERSKLTINETEYEYSGAEMLKRDDRLLCPIVYFADLLGYETLTEDGITYLANAKKFVTSEKKEEAKERFELYKTVVLNYDDVEADKRGVGVYESTPYEERQVGIAYSTWHDTFAKWNNDYWGRPLDGVYLSDNRAVIRRHGEMLSEAGIDFIFVDWSNNTGYDASVQYLSSFDMIEKSVGIIFEEWSKIENAPKICIFVGPGHNGASSIESGQHQRKVDQVWNDYVTNPEYADMYYYYEGKPLLICYAATPTLYGSTPETTYWDDDRFTVRWMSGYVGQQKRKLVENADILLSRSHWSWEEREAQTFTVLDGRVECITCSAATRAQGTEGSSGYIPAAKRNDGATLKKQFQRANDLGAGIVLLTTWNEWLGSEQLSSEESKDLEPSKAHGTFYYDLMCQQIRKYKGEHASSDE